MRSERTLILLIGLCTFSSASWSNCVGDCENGYGTRTWPNGTKYAGPFENGKAEGQGTATFISGDRYEGKWKNSQRNGWGTYTYLDGEKYVGQFEDNEFHGSGTYHYSDGRDFEGQFRSGQPIRGQGIEYLPDGRRLLFKSGTVDLHARYGSGAPLRANVKKNELDLIRRESVESKRRADNLQTQQKNKKLIVGVQKQLIEYQYLNGTADGIAGKNTSIAIKRFYQDAQIVKPSLDDYATITRDLDFNLMNAKDTCFKNSASQPPYSVCFSIQM